jgi:alkylation response protein AidB-like acyl-CoA dehydrogenase
MMNFEYPEEQQHIAASARDFAEKYIRPYIMEWDEAQFFPVDLFKKAGEMGFMGVFVPEEYGGSGLGYHPLVYLSQPIIHYARDIFCILAMKNKNKSGYQNWPRQNG